MSSETATNLDQWNAKRKRAVELRVAGKSLPHIRRETGLSAPTVIAAHKAYLEGGWDAVPLEGRGRKRGVGRVLDAAQEHATRAALSQAPETVGVATGVWTLSNTARWVHERFGVAVEERTLARYVARWGLALAPWRKVASMGNATVEWWNTRLPELVKTARSREAQVVWVCASPLPTGEGSLLRAQTLKGRIAWRVVPAAVDDAAIRHFIEQLSQALGTPLCVAFHGHALAEAGRPDDVWPCPVGPEPQASTPATAAEAQPAPPAALARGPLNTPSLPEASAVMTPKLTHLQRLEAESIHILREVVAECENPVMLYSIGKDSAVMLHLARKAFYPAPPPFPLLHVDTTWKFRDMYAMRERMAKELDMKLIVHQNPEAVALGINPFMHGSQIHTDLWKTQGLKQALDLHKFDAAFGGARRDEEKSRAKERIFSFRSAQHRWDPKNQRPELWHLYNARMHKGESMRVFPISNWTELDVWQYIYLENIPIVPLYFAAVRPVVERDGALIMVDDDRMPLKPGEKPQMRKVRFRTLGCYPLTGAVESSAQTLPEIIQEMLLTRTSERQGRVIDHDASASMEKKKQEGYF